jgi:hypothetical protein
MFKHQKVHRHPNLDQRRDETYNPVLFIGHDHGDVAELVDARVSKTRYRKVVWVRFPPSPSVKRAEPKILKLTIQYLRLGSFLASFILNGLAVAQERVVMIRPAASG